MNSRYDDWEPRRLPPYPSLDPDRPRPRRRRPPQVPWIWRRWQLREIAALIVLPLFPTAAIIFDLSFFLIVESIFFACMGGLAVVLLRGDWRFFGPQFYYDVVCLARRGRSTNVRVLYVSILLIGQGFVYASSFSQRQPLGKLLFESDLVLERNDVVAFAAKFVGIVIIIQNLAVVLLTPIYAATAITEERERGTLELMFTTHLSDREIVLGKLSGRLLHIGGVLLAGLPVLSLSQFLGGVDMMVLLANFALTAMNLATVGAVCIMVSVYSRKALAAVLISYAVLLIPTLFFGCASWRLMLAQEGFSGSGSGDTYLLEVLGGFLLLHMVIGGTCLAVAVAGLRSLREADQIPRSDSFDEYWVGRPSDPRLEVDERIVLRRASRTLPPIKGDPLMWKEMNQGSGIIAYSPAFWVPLGATLIPTFLILMTTILSRRGFNEEGAFPGSFAFLKFLLILVAAQFCVGVAYRACSCIAGERQQGTLDALLTLPIMRRDILWSKWLGGLVKGWGWSLFFVPMLLLGMIGGGVHFLLGFGFLACIIAHAAFLASLGMLLSIVSPSVLAAQTRMVLVILFFLTMYLIDVMLGNEGWIGRINDFLNPLSSWAFLTASWWDVDRMTRVEIEYRSLAAALDMTWFAAAAFVLWLVACRRFAATFDGK
jgi:ABC-type transport system involved in multi-copper enzyme maturation permease subunit